MNKFLASKEEGEKAECCIDEFFSKTYHIEPLNRELQLLTHCDRVFIAPDGTRWLLEYKTDWAAHETRNFFIETIGNDNKNSPGWAYTCLAQIFVLWIPGEELAYIIDGTQLKHMLSKWQEQYPTRLTRPKLNDGYRSGGVLVPVSEIATISLVPPVKIVYNRG